MKTWTFNLIACGLAISLLPGAMRIYAQENTPLYDPPPTYPGFELPHIAGSLRYSLSVSETIRTGRTGTNTLYQTHFSGNAGYISRSTQHPFSMIYSGGVSAGNTQGGSRIFQDLAVSQSLTLQRWSFLATDAISYLPESAGFGLSGVAGIGDVGSEPVQTGSSSANGLQSNSSTRLTNSASGSVHRSLTGRTSLSISGTYSILRFLGNTTGLENDRESGTVGVSHVLSARTQLSSSYFYSQATHSLHHIETTAQGANLSLSHEWSARLNSDFSGGPVFIKTTGGAGKIDTNFSASLAYLLGSNNFAVTASRSTNTGSGVTYSSQATAISGSLTRKLGRFSSASARVAYLHSAILPSSISPTYAVSGVNSTVQLSRSLSRTLSTYASYGVRQQNVPSNGFAVNALQGIQQTVGFGLTYSPRPITIGR